MISFRLVRSAIFGAALLAAGPAVAQYQELPVETDAGEGYSWSVRVNDDEVVLAGDVPYLSVKELLSARAGGEAVDRMGVAEGAPLGFMIDAITAVEASALLSEGAVTYADDAWTVSGALRTDADRAALEAILGERTAASDPWVIELEEGMDQDASVTADADTVEPGEDGPDAAEELAVAERTGEASGANVTADGEISDPVIEELLPATVDDIEPGADELAPTSEADAVEGAEDQVAEPESASGKEVIADAAAEATVTDLDVADSSPVAELETGPVAEPEPVAAATPDPDYAFTAEITENGLAFSGQVPDAATRLLAGNMASGLDGVAELTVADGAPDNFTKTAFAGIAALEYLETGSVSLGDGQWRIEGEAAIDTDSQAAVETLDRLGDANIWDVAITAPAAIDICGERVETYMADRAILFGSGSARLTEDSEADLTGLAEIFAICPSAPVYVEGHTDADGGAEDNLILSLSRAEAVVDALVDLGIDPGRLYAVGYGASLPIASNETAAGKAQNRRIVFSFEDIAGN